MEKHMKMDKYIQLLKKYNLKITPQRLEILNYLDTHRSHPTADEIYRYLKENNPSLSKTTVYNTLDVLVDNHIIRTLIIEDSGKHFDIRTNQHCHFFCRVCKRIIDIDIKTCPNIEVTASMGYKIEEIHGYIKGVCKECMNKGVVKNESRSTT